MATLATSMRRGPEGLFDTAQQIGRRRRLLPGPHPSCSVTGAGNSLLELVLSVVVLLALIASRLLLLLLSLFLLRQHVRLNGELYVLQLLLGTLLPFLRAELTFLDVAGTALGQMSSPPSVVRHTVLFTVCSPLIEPLGGTIVPVWIWGTRRFRLVHECWKISVNEGKRWR